MSIEDILNRIAVALECIAKNTAGIDFGAANPRPVPTGAVANASDATPKRGPGRPPKPKVEEPTEEEVSAAGADDTPADDGDAGEPEAPAAPAPKASNSKAVEAQRQTLKLAFKDLLGNKGRDAASKLLAKYKATSITGIAEKDLMAATVDAKKQAAA